MKKVKLISILCSTSIIATTAISLSSCSFKKEHDLDSIECTSDKQKTIKEKETASFNFKFTGNPKTKINISISGDDIYKLSTSEQIEVLDDNTFSILVGFVTQPDQDCTQAFSLNFNFVDRNGDQASQTIDGFSLSYKKEVPVYVNEVKLLDSPIQTLEKVNEFNFHFELDKPLEGEDFISCEAQDIVGTNTLNISVAEHIEMGQDPTKFELKIKVYKTNGGEPYDKDNIQFKLIFKGKKGDVITFNSEVSGFKLEYHDESFNKYIPLDKLIIEDGVLRGLNCGWDDESIANCDTLYIPNNVVETVWDQTVTDIATLGSQIKKLKFEEGINPLFINKGSFTQLSNVETLILPKRLSYFGQRVFNYASKLKTIDITSWDEEKFNRDNPFGESYVLYRNVPSSGEFILSPEISVGIDAYYTFSTVNKNFKGWTNLPKPTKEGQKTDGFTYDIFGEGDEAKKIITDWNSKATANALVIPNWCYSIKPKAFVDDSGASPTTTLAQVSTINVADGSKLQKLYAGCFGYLKKVDVNVDLSNATQLKYLDNGIFAGATKLKSVVLPDSIISISANCFYDCKSLTSIDLSKTQITKISLATFAGCSNLQTVQINENVTWIGASAFYNCSNLTTKFDISKNIVYIGSSAFCNCTKVSIILPTNDDSKLSYLGEQAFYNSTISGNVYIPSSVTYICNGVFGHNYNINGISVSSNCQGYYATDGYLYDKNGDLLFACGNSGEIPTSITNIKPYSVSGIQFQGSEMDLSQTQIKTIGSSAFFETISTESSGFDIILPQSLEYISANAFEKSEVKNINLSELSNLKTISKAAFKSCKKIENMVIPSSFTSIEEETFKECSIQNLTIPNTINTIKNMGFQSCAFGSIDLSSFETMPTGWCANSFESMKIKTGTSITIYINNAGLENSWKTTLKAACGTSNLPMIKWVVGSPSNN